MSLNVKRGRYKPRLITQGANRGISLLFARGRELKPIFGTLRGVYIGRFPLSRPGGSVLAVAPSRKGEYRRGHQPWQIKIPSEAEEYDSDDAQHKRDHAPPK